MRVASTLGGGFHPEVTKREFRSEGNGVSAKKRKICAENLANFESLLLTKGFYSF